MMSRTAKEFVDNTCTRKVPFHSLRAAKKACHKGIIVYKCMFCKFWHVGHPKHKGGVQASQKKRWTDTRNYRKLKDLHGGSDEK